MESADDKLDSMIYECLDDELRKKLTERIEQADKNDEDTSKPGQFALAWLKTKYNVEQLSFIETVDKYMDYLSTVKTRDQNLYQYAESLKDKLNDLHDSQWSMTDLYLVLVLAHSMKSTDVDKRGEKVDYSKITKRISEALSIGEKLEPSTITDMLQTENAVSKSALKLVASGTSADPTENENSIKAHQPGLDSPSFHRACGVHTVHRRKNTRLEWLERAFCNKMQSSCSFQLSI